MIIDLQNMISLPEKSGKVLLKPLTCTPVAEEEQYEIMDDRKLLFQSQAFLFTFSQYRSRKRTNLDFGRVIRSQDYCF